MSGNTQHFQPHKITKNLLWPCVTQASRLWSQPACRCPVQGIHINHKSFSRWNTQKPHHAVTMHEIGYSTYTDKCKRPADAKHCKGKKCLFQVYSFCILVPFEYKQNQVTTLWAEVSLHGIYCLQSSLHDYLSVMYSCFVYAPWGQKPTTRKLLSHRNDFKKAKSQAR